MKDSRREQQGETEKAEDWGDLATFALSGPRRRNFFFFLFLSSPLLTPLSHGGTKGKRKDSFSFGDFLLFFRLHHNPSAGSFSLPLFIPTPRSSLLLSYIPTTPPLLTTSRLHRSMVTLPVTARMPPPPSKRLKPDRSNSSLVAKALGADTSSPTVGSLPSPAPSSTKTRQRKGRTSRLRAQKKYKELNGGGERIESGKLYCRAKSLTTFGLAFTLQNG